MVKMRLIAIIFLSIISCNESGAEKTQRPKSALRWISKQEVENLPGGWTNKNLVRSIQESRHTEKGTYCRVEADGCFYPGFPANVMDGQVWQTLFGEEQCYGSFAPHSRIRKPCTTKTLYCQPIVPEKIHPAQPHFEVLYNPDGVSDYTWQAWPEGKYNLKFPLGVVKTDENCNLMIGRYQDNGERALVTEKGYVYYHKEPYQDWYYDGNEYDLLVERTVRNIELLELTYEDPIKSESRRFEGDTSLSSTVFINDGNTETEMSASLSMWYTNQKSWSHSVTFAVKAGFDVEVESGSIVNLFAGVKATYKFETSFSYSNGWAGARETKRISETSVKKNVPPKHQIKVQMIMKQNIVDVPYTAKYRLTYEGGRKKVVYDKGVMRKVFYSDSRVISSDAESLIENGEINAIANTPRTHRGDFSSESQVEIDKVESRSNANMIDKVESRSNANMNSLLPIRLDYCFFIISVISYIH